MATVNDNEYRYLSTYFGDFVGTINDLRNRYWDGLANGTLGVAVTPTYTISGVLTVSTGDFKFYNDSGRTLRILKVRASVGTAPTGTGSTVFDVKKDGTTIFPTSTKPTLVAAALTDARVPDTTAWANGSYMTVDITAIAATTAGSNAVVTITAV